MDSKTTLDTLRFYYNVVTDSREVVFIGLYGSQNYGLDTPTSDIDAHCVAVPSIEKLTLGDHSRSNSVYDFPLGKVSIKDIDEMSKMWLKQSVNFCEILFTPYKIANPKYEEETNILFDNAELIATANREAQMRCLLGMIGNMVDRIVVESRPIEKRCKEAARVIYCYSFMKKLAVGRSFKECLDPHGDENYDLMMEFKNYQNQDRVLDISGYWDCAKELMAKYKEPEKHIDEARNLLIDANTKILKKAIL